MSHSNIDNIMARIAVATKVSPIAVFSGSKGLNAVFGATIDTLALIKNKPDNYIGMFYGDMNLEEVRNILEGIK